jgi:hypothetical protein
MVRSRSETNLNKIFLELCTSPSIRNKLGHIRNNQRQHNPPLPKLQLIKSISCTDLTKIHHDNNDDVQSTSMDDTQTETLDLTIPLQLPPPKIPITPTPLITFPLIPMESTGFVIQTSTFLTNRSTLSFETTLLNSTERPYKQYSSMQTERSHESYPSIQIEKPSEQYPTLTIKRPLEPYSPLPIQRHHAQYPSLQIQRPLEQYSPLQTQRSHKQFLPIQNSSSNNDKSKTTSLVAVPSNDRKHQDYTNRLRDRLKSRGHLRKFFLS